MKNLLSFRVFIEEQEEKPDYFDALEDEEGISWDQLVQNLQLDPQVSAHFKMGGIEHKLSSWEIVPGSFSKGGASIRLKVPNGTKDRAYRDGSVVKSSPDDKVYYLQRPELVKFLTTGWTPAVEAQDQAGMGMGSGMDNQDPSALGGL